MSEQTHLQTLITNHTRRLQKLKEQRALTGLSTDPGILIEIEDIEAELNQLHEEVVVFESQPEQQTRLQVGEEAASSDGEQIDLHHIEAKLEELKVKLTRLENRSGSEPQFETDPTETASSQVQIQLPPTGLNNFDSAQVTLLQRLYPNEQRVMIEREFGGGFGGTRVFLVRPINRRGRQLARQIVKIGPSFSLKKEQENYDKYVGRSHPFVVAQVTHFIEWQGLGGIIYNFIGGSRLGQPRTLEEVFLDKQVSAEAINGLLEALLDSALGEGWYHQAEPHHCFFDDEYGPHLVEYLRLKIRPYSQDGIWLAEQAPDMTKGYRLLRGDNIPAEHADVQPESLIQIEELIITKVKSDVIKLQYPTQPGIVVKVELQTETNFTPGQMVIVRGEVRYNRPTRLAQIMSTVFANVLDTYVDPKAKALTWIGKNYPNPLHLYPDILSRALEGKKSLVHGDLHLRNILVDRSNQGWLIDFALVKERHNLYDFIKLEVFIRQMVLAQEQYDFSFADYVQFEEALLDEAVAVPDDGALRKVYQVIRKIRESATHYTRNFAAEYLPALFLYSLAVVKYVDNHGVKATRLAFGTAGVVGEAILSKKVPKEQVTKTPSQINSSQIMNQQEKDKPIKKIKYHDVFTHFEIGLERLVEQIGTDHPRYSDFLVYEEKLTNIIKRSRRFGDIRERQADRAEVIDQLNALALSTVGISFNELCRD